MSEDDLRKAHKLASLPEDELYFETFDESELTRQRRMLRWTRIFAQGGPWAEGISAITLKAAYTRSCFNEAFFLDHNGNPLSDFGKGVKLCTATFADAAVTSLQLRRILTTEAAACHDPGVLAITDAALDHTERVSKRHYAQKDIAKTAKDWEKIYNINWTEKLSLPPLPNTERSSSSGSSSKSRKSPKALSLNGEPCWEVEEVLDQRGRPEAREYLIRWKGCEEKSWEPKCCLVDCADVLNTFKSSPTKRQKLN